MRADAAPGCYDVIIVGAGPTGLTLANLLGLEGLSVLVVERNATTVQEPRAVSIDDESLRTMQAAGLIEQVREQIVPGYGSRYLTPAGACFLTVLPTGRPYGHPRRNAFRQPVLEQQLRDGLARFPNVATRFGASVTGFVQDEDDVVVTIAGDDAHGDTQADGRKLVRTRYLVGCDGASSPTRKALGIDLEGETRPERWLIVDLAESPAQRDTLVFCDVRRPCIALPGPDRTRRFEFKLFAGESAEAILAPGSVARLLASRGIAPGSQLVRKTVYTFHARLAHRWSAGRVFLAGDAAHLTPPFAGQGMNSGVRDAHNLAWKLAAVVRGELGPALLDSYEVERRDHVAGMIDLALRMGRIMGPPSRARGWLVQTALRVAGLWPPLRAYFGEMKYKPKPRFRAGFLVASAHLLVGRLLPQPEVATAGGQAALLDDLLPHGFVLIGLDVTLEATRRIGATLEIGTLATVSLALATLPSPTGDDASALHVVGEVPPELAAAAGSLLLVRPDRYVMAAFAPGEAQDAVAAITTLFARNQPAVAAVQRAAA